MSETTLSPQELERREQRRLRRNALAKRYREANPDKVRASRERYRAKNPEKLREYEERRKASGANARKAAAYRERMAALGIKSRRRPGKTAESGSPEVVRIVRPACPPPENRERRFEELRRLLLERKLRA